MSDDRAKRDAILPAAVETTGARRAEWRRAGAIYRIASTISLVLLITTMLLWASSVWLNIYWLRNGSEFPRRYEVASDGGRIWWSSVRESVPERFEGWNGRRGGRSLASWTAERFDERSGALAGFVWSLHPNNFSSGSVVAIPHWFFAILFSIVPFFRWRARRRSRPGHCPSCNYDLRASRDRCPECGRAIESPGR